MRYGRYENFEDYLKCGLDPKYTFDTFVVASHNLFANSAAEAVAESPGERYNPLFIYGGTGLGKTHLMQSIGNRVWQQNSAMKILYVTSEEFMNEVVETIRSGNSVVQKRFYEKYCTPDVLLFDDVQFIAGRTWTQEKFLQIFNRLYLSGKQIVLSSDSAPMKIENLDERLCFQFEKGLIVDITSPDFETQKKILRQKAEAESCCLAEDVIEYITENEKFNIRELEHVLRRLIKFSSLENNAIDISMAKEILKK